MAEIELQNPSKLFTDALFEWQREVLFQFDTVKKRFFMLKAHRRARKTSLSVNLLIREAISHPNSVYVYIAPFLNQAKKIIWDDPNMIFKFLPPRVIEQQVIYTVNNAELFIRFYNNSYIHIRGADKPDSLRGLDATGVIFDEFALQKAEIWQEIFLPIIRQNNKRWALFLYTPKGISHATDLWRTALGSKEWFTLMLKASVSGIIPKEELEAAKREMPEALYLQEYEVEELTDDAAVVISQLSIENLQNINVIHTQKLRIISCDPASGGDECVIYIIENGKIIDEKFMYEKDTMKIAGEIMVLSARHKIKDIIIDSCGLGKPIADRLRELELNVIYFNSAEKAMDEKRFRNKRAELWWYGGDQITKGLVAYPQDLELRKQLSSARYEIVESNGKIALTPKSETKVMIGRSPDRADSFLMGIYGLQKVEDADKVKQTLKNMKVNHSLSMMSY